MRADDALLPIRARSPDGASLEAEVRERRLRLVARLESRDALPAALYAWRRLWDRLLRPTEDGLPERQSTHGLQSSAEDGASMPGPSGKEC